MSMKQRSNQEWISDLQSDGAARFDALEDLRVILLNGLRRGLVGQVNTAGPDFEAMAEDFVQESLLKVLANVDSFGGRSKFTTWAHKIAVRVALTELRRKRWKDYSLDEMVSADSGYSQAFPDQAPTPGEQSERQDLLAQLMRIIEEELTPKQRMAMQLIPIGGVPMPEAAERMGMKRNAMYKLLHDARLRIKQRLEKEGMSSSEILASFAN